MTFCLGITVKEGLIAIADTRITSGSEVITAKKVSVYEISGNPFFIMTSGLRSIRDKALTYFEEAIEDDSEPPPDRLFKVVNILAEQVRRVAREDKAALNEGGFHFNIYTLIGGQLSRDKDHKLYLLYPQGNWVEVSQGTPYCIIGAMGYGKPVLDRTLKYGDPMRFALKVGCLAFDSTRISASDVDFPIDVVLYQRATRGIVEHRFDKGALSKASDWWQERLRQSINEIPPEWIDEIFAKLSPPGDSAG